jgi:hypothetical protein
LRPALFLAPLLALALGQTLYLPLDDRPPNLAPCRGPVLCPPREAYTDEEWALLEPLIPAPKTGGRPAKVSRREIMNAIQKVFP